MGCTRSPSGCKEEKLAGVCAEAVAPDGMASVTAEAAAVEAVLAPQVPRTDAEKAARDLAIAAKAEDDFDNMPV